LPQHEIVATGYLAVCAYREAMEDVVNRVDEAKAMRAGIKIKSFASRQKLGKLITIANPKLGDKFLA
jgi:hypothetical protein